MRCSSCAYTHTLALASLDSHEGPVWQVAWAHPKFGPILASASYDGKVIIWKNDGGTSGSAAPSVPSAYGASTYGAPPVGAQGNSAGWSKIKEHALHGASGELVLLCGWMRREQGRGAEKQCGRRGATVRGQVHDVALAVAEMGNAKKLQMCRSASASV